MRFLPAGPQALLVELDAIEDVAALVAEIDRRRAAGWSRPVVDVVPGAVSVLLDGLDDPRAAAAELASWVASGATGPAWPPAGAEAGRAGDRQAPLVEVPCRYGGPDLAAVASHWGVSADDVPGIHAGLEHRVAFCGFAPGFAYLTGLGRLGGVPRLATPRPAVPQGSVAVAGDFTGVYPRPSPGGWRIIGRTDLVLWDAARPRPALLAPGTVVRFVVV